MSTRFTSHVLLLMTPLFFVAALPLSAQSPVTITLENVEGSDASDGVIPPALPTPLPTIERPASTGDDPAHVRLRVLVDKSGKAQEIHKIDATGEDRLVNTVVAAVQGMTFTPGTENGAAVAMPVIVTVRFEGTRSGLPTHRKADSADNESAKGHGMDDYVPIAKAPGYDLNELQKDIVYPQVARDNHVEGRVTLSVKVSELGEPLEIVIRQSTDPIFNESSIEAVKRLRFTPARQEDGKAISMWVTFNVNYKLK